MQSYLAPVVFFRLPRKVNSLNENLTKHAGFSMIEIYLDSRHTEASTLARTKLSVKVCRCLK